MILDQAWALLLICTAAVALPGISRLVRLPEVALQILFGVLLGASGLNLEVQGHFLPFLAELGFLLLMFQAGMELDFGAMASQSRGRLAFQGLLFASTLALAVAAATALGQGVFTALILSTTSLGLVVPTLREGRCDAHGAGPVRAAGGHGGRLHDAAGHHLLHALHAPRPGLAAGRAAAVFRGRGASAAPCAAVGLVESGQGRPRTGRRRRPGTGGASVAGALVSAGGRVRDGASGAGAGGVHGRRGVGLRAARPPGAGDQALGHGLRLLPSPCSSSMWAWASTWPTWPRRRAWP